MDARTEALGMLAAETEPVWAIRYLGQVPDDPSAKTTWERKAGQIAAVREMTGFRSAHEALGPMPAGGAVEVPISWFSACPPRGLMTDNRIYQS